MAESKAKPESKAKHKAVTPNEFLLEIRKKNTDAMLEDAFVHVYDTYVVKDRIPHKGGHVFIVEV